jgi:hypothetical protein
MISKLFLASLFISLALTTSLSTNVIPIQPGVPNTISFACAPISGSSSSSGLSITGSSSGLLTGSSSSSSDLTSLISTLASALGSNTNTASLNPNHYTYSFSGLPSWVSSVNGPVISGIPPSSGTNSYTITITVSGANGQSTTQNVLLAAPGSSGFSSGPVGSGSLSFTSDSNIGSAFSSGSINNLQLNNIYNPLNPGSPFNPFSIYNPNGVNYGGSTGSFNIFFSNQGSQGTQNIFNPNNANSPFNPNNANSLYNPNNPNSPFAGIFNPNSPLYNPNFQSTGNTVNLFNPSNPNSIFYPTSPNYNPNFAVPESGVSTNVLYASQSTSGTFSTTVMLTPTPITLTPPPTPSSPTSSPSYVSASNPTYSSEQVQALLSQQTRAQNDLANALAAYTNANNALNTLQAQVDVINKNLNDASKYQISTNAALQKAIADQTTGTNQINYLTTYITTLNNQLGNAKNALDNANNQLANDQAQITQGNAAIGSAQNAITNAQTILQDAINRLNDAQRGITACQTTIRQSQ